MKSQVMSNIVRMLENEGPFKDVIYVILENVSKYLKMPDVTVMQYDEERTCLYPVLSYGGRHHLIQAAEVQAEKQNYTVCLRNQIWMKKSVS